VAVKPPIKRKKKMIYKNSLSNLIMVNLGSPRGVAGSPLLTAVSWMKLNLINLLMATMILT
jgi:hypothetical protein